jgi:hypothetical protein
LAVITSFYEVFTTMASGALVAAILFSLQAPVTTELVLHPVLSSVLLLAVLIVPLLPAVFNRLVQRMARRYQKVESLRLPPLHGSTVLFGFAVTSAGWGVLGVSLWAAVQAVAPEVEPLTLRSWALYTAMMSLSYVAGFAVFMLPSGIGVREGLLDRILGPELATSMPQGRAVATVVVLLIRVLWTAMELLVGALLIWRPGAQLTEPEPPGEERDPSLAGASEADRR